MITEPTAVADLVVREVRNGSRNGIATKVAVARRDYPTDPADLWDAVANAERLPRWFLPVSGDLRVGGHYRLEGNASGVVERCDPPESFAVTWEYGPMVSWLQVAVRPSSSGAVLELVHEAPVDPDLWGQFGPGEFVRRAAGGWAEAAVRGGDASDAARAAAERTVGFYTVGFSPGAAEDGSAT